MVCKRGERSHLCLSTIYVHCERLFLNREGGSPDQLSATYNPVFISFSRWLNSNSHLASGGLSKSHNRLRQGPTTVSSFDNDLHLFSHLGSCGEPEDQ